MSVVLRLHHVVSQDFSWTYPWLISGGEVASIKRYGATAKCQFKTLPHDSMPVVLTLTCTPGTITDNGDGTSTWPWTMTAPASALAALSGIVYWDVLYECGGAVRNVGRGTCDFTAT